MQFQAYNKILIVKDGMYPVELEGQPLGFKFYIRYPSYRGTFLSCIEDLRFCLDAEEIPAEHIRFRLGGKEYILPQLKEAYKEYWYVMDQAEILVYGKAPAIGAHKITVHMKHRIPYAGYGGSYLSLVSDVTESLDMKVGENK